LLSLTVVVVAFACSTSDVSREVGARCDALDECDDRCLPPGTDYPGGFCTVSCLGSADCPSDTACVAEAGGVCLFTCLDPSHCGFLGDGWTCRAQPALPDGEVQVCIGQP
jgi:hypothetical protein